MDLLEDFRKFTRIRMRIFYHRFLFVFHQLQLSTAHDSPFLFKQVFSCQAKSLVENSFRVSWNALLYTLMAVSATTNRKEMRVIFQIFRVFRGSSI